MVFLKWVKRNLEVEDRDGVIVLLVHGSWNTSDTNVDLGLDLKFVPIPEKEHPVWLTCQGNDDLVFILGWEAGAQELFGLVIVAVDILIRESLLLLLRVDIIDSAHGSVSPFTYCQEPLRFWNGYGGDLLGALLTLEHVLVLFISRIHNDVVSGCVKNLVLIDQMQVVSQLTVNTKDETGTYCDTLKA